MIVEEIYRAEYVDRVKVDGRLVQGAAHSKEFVQRATGAVFEEEVVVEAENNETRCWTVRKRLTGR